MSFNYPIGKAVPPPPGGAAAGPGWGPPAGAPGGWAPPSNAWSGSGGWSQPTGAWAAPTGAWTVGGGGYPPSGGNQPFTPPLVPESTPHVSSGIDADAIEYFKAMSDQDVIPDEGRVHFLKLAGADGAIDAFELEDILNKVFLSEFTFNGFSSDMTRSLVAMRDYDISGKLGFEDFRRLWTDLAWCKRTFIMFDINKSGAFCKTEFSKVLETIGITVTPRVYQALVMRYADKDGNIRFDDFVLCYIRLKTMMTTYQGKDPQNTGMSEFERDEFVQLAIYS